jgi:hypothetical protein
MTIYTVEVRKYAYELWLLPASFSFYFVLLLKPRNECFTETSVDFQRSTPYYNREDRALRNNRCESLKSYNIKKDIKEIV